MIVREMGSKIRYERETLKYYNVGMILICHSVSYYYRIISWWWYLKKTFEENGKEEQQSAKGRQVITLTLAITMRVTLVGDFQNPISPSIYIYIIF